MLRNRLARSVAGLVRVREELSTVNQDLEQLRVQTGWLQSRRVAEFDDVEDAEFRVFSQFGEDGIIQFLIQRIPVENEIFVEFGVSDYREANTRFLLVHDNWSGLIMDASENHRRFVEASGLGWRHGLDTVSAFIDRENIDGLISGAGIRGDIGLLSVDLDGNDYWVLEAIECVSPRIIVAEYNSVFGPEAAVTIPYDPSFVRGEAHWSWLYWGASLAALTHLAERKGYALVAGNHAGNNAFFVRRDVLGELRERRPSDVYRASRFRESRGRDGALTYVSDLGERLRIIGDQMVWDVERNASLRIADRFGIR